MKELKRNTKLYKHYLSMYKNATNKTIFDAYKNPSQTKINSYLKLVQKYTKEYNEIDIKIIGHNCDYYTMAIMVYDTGYLYIETYLNTFKLKL